MNRADRRREAKLLNSGKKSAAIGQAIGGMVEPIVVLLNARQFDRAEAALNEILAASPDHAEALHLQGLLLCQTERADAGIASLQRAVTLVPGEALYWNNLAAAYSRNHQWDKSIEAARKATALDPSYVDPQYILTNVLLAEGNIAEGTDELAKLAMLKPDDEKLWHQLARQRAEQKRFGEAEEAYKRTLELMPENIAAMRELSAIYMNTWRYDAAQSLRKRADELETAKS